MGSTRGGLGTGSGNRDGREREIGKMTKAGVVIWLLTGIFGIFILVGSTRPESFYVAIFLLSINFSIILISMIWKVSGYLNKIVGKINE